MGNVACKSRITKYSQSHQRGPRGLFTTAFIPAKTRVTSYSGEIIDPDSMPPTGTDRDVSYYRSISQGQVARVIDGFRDPRPCFGMAQFANDPEGDDKNPSTPHPNCKFEVEDKEGKTPQVYLVSTRDVTAGFTYAIAHHAP